MKRRAFVAALGTAACAGCISGGSGRPEGLTGTVHDLGATATAAGLEVRVDEYNTAERLTGTDAPSVPENAVAVLARLSMTAVGDGSVTIPDGSGSGINGFHAGEYIGLWAVYDAVESNDETYRPWQVAASEKGPEIYPETSVTGWVLFPVATEFDASETAVSVVWGDDVEHSWVLE